MINHINVKGAIAHFQIAIKINPKNAAFYINLGHALSQQKDFKNAILQLQSGLKYDPGNASLYSNLATALRSLKNYKEAVFNYRKAIELEPNVPSYLFKPRPCVSRFKGL